jgi:hypothetical protein
LIRERSGAVESVVLLCVIPMLVDLHIGETLERARQKFGLESKVRLTYPTLFARRRDDPLTYMCKSVDGPFQSNAWKMVEFEMIYHFCIATVPISRALLDS